MKKHSVFHWGVWFLGLVASQAWGAEPLSVYAAACKDKLEIDRIPGYSCFDGISIPSSEGFGLISSNNYLGKVDTGNPDVDAVFLCRSVSGSGSSSTAGLNGYIRNRSFYTVIPQHH